MTEEEVKEEEEEISVEEESESSLWNAEMEEAENDDDKDKEHKKIPIIRRRKRLTMKSPIEHDDADSDGSDDMIFPTRQKAKPVRSPPTKKFSNYSNPIWCMC